MAGVITGQIKSTYLRWFGYFKPLFEMIWSLQVLIGDNVHFRPLFEKIIALRIFIWNFFKKLKPFHREEPSSRMFWSIILIGRDLPSESQIQSIGFWFVFISSLILHLRSRSVKMEGRCTMRCRSRSCAWCIASTPSCRAHSSPSSIWPCRRKASPPPPLGVVISTPKSPTTSLWTAISCEPRSPRGRARESRSLGTKRERQ